MLTLQKCRSLLGTDCKLTDVALEQLRQEMYAYADVALESLRASKVPGGLPVPSCLDAIPPDEREAIAERAAILEYEGHLKKPQAERQAFGEWAQSKGPSKRPRKRVTRKKSRKPKSG